MKAIGIFKSACPAGWTRIDSWNGLFLRGWSTYGGTGGAAQHTHSVNYPSTVTGTGVVSARPVPGVNSPRRYYVPPSHTHTMDIPSGDSVSASNTPGCIDVVFCSFEEGL
ncbi:MAG: hypothetical protein GY950_10530 [bacterium]|nr:hypothetical protein [bacterium]